MHLFGRSLDKVVDPLVHPFLEDTLNEFEHLESDHLQLFGISGPRGVKISAMTAVGAVGHETLLIQFPLRSLLSGPLPRILGTVSEHGIRSGHMVECVFGETSIELSAHVKDIPAVVLPVCLIEQLRSHWVYL